MKYLVFVCLVIVVYAILFHFIMMYEEGEQHSWVTGFYWTLTVMSTLGFGDITFHSDLGRIFSMVVLLSGIVLLLIVLPFAFIRFFYAPWLEAQIRMRAPRQVPPDTHGHVILSGYDSITPGLIKRLQQEDIPYFIIEADPDVAANRHLDGISVITGEIDSKTTYEALCLKQARLVLANCQDTVNTNIVLTVRELEPAVPVVAIVSEEDSVDILQLSGATHVLPLKKWLGEQLANRVNALHAQTHVIGQYRDLLISELPLHNTPLAGKTIRETRLRQISGVSIVGIWERGQLLPARPDTQLSDSSVLVVIGREEQLSTLNELLVIYDVNPNPVLVIGGGRVGASAVHTLHHRDIPVNLVERDAALCERLQPACNETFAGDASDYKLLERAGIMKTPSVVLTTSDDAMNIYLASYCRRLNPEIRIISRITHERNLESIHRAGADFVLSYASLGVESIFSILKGKELLMLGEKVNVFSMLLPRSLHEKSIAETEIGLRTGLTVIALQRNGEVITNVTSSTVLTPGTELLMLGDTRQRQDFIEVFGDGEE